MAEQNLAGCLPASFHRPVDGTARLSPRQCGHRILALILEFELRRVEHFATRKQACTAVAAWIEDYNTKRRHTACQKMPPARYEQVLAAREAA